jgi:hypothetical protein
MITVGKIGVHEFITLDGVIGDPSWSFDYSFDLRPEHTMTMFRLLGGGVIGDLAGLPASQLAVLPGTSHVGSLDRVDWLHSMILEFLGSPVPRPL